MKYAILLTLLGLAQIVLAATSGFLSPLLWWSGVSWILAGCAYAFPGIGSRVFGKRLDGSVAWLNVCLLFPYLAVTWLLWHIQRVLSKEPTCHEIAPNLWLGRRCSNKKLPQGVGLIVDLTAEFHERKDVRTGREYLCLPILDASAPSAEAFHQLIQAVSDAAQNQKGIYVHCAKGHGRSAAVVIAALVAMEKAATISEAEQKVREARRGVKINAVQQHLLEQWQANRIVPI